MRDRPFSRVVGAALHVAIIFGGPGWYAAEPAGAGVAAGVDA